MRTSDLNSFITSIFSLSYGNGIWKIEPTTLTTLKQQTAAFREAYISVGPTAVETKNLSSSIEGSLLGCQTLEILSSDKVDALIGSLHNLFGKSD